MIPQSKSSKYRLQSLIGQFRPGTTLDNATGNLQPNADHNVDCQLCVLHADAPLEDRFGNIRLEVGADSQFELSGGL